MIDNEKEILANMMVRLLTTKDNWVDEAFGVEGNRLYVDGCTSYQNEEEKNLIKKIIGIKPEIIRCPYCHESHYIELNSDITSVYYPPIYKDGININPDNNMEVTYYRCLGCHQNFSIKS